MAKIRIQKLLNILSRYPFTSDKVHYLKNCCRLSDFTQLDFDDALRFVELEPHSYLSKEEKRQALLDYYTQEENLEKLL